MTAIIFIVLAAGLSILDVIALKNKGQKKDVFVYLSLMAASVLLCLWYFTGYDRQSIADVIMQICGIQG